MSVPVRRPRKHGDDGAVAITLALVMCLVVVPLGGLAVDLGMQRIARGDLQAIADVTATDMARSLGSGVVPTGALAEVSAQRSSTVLGNEPHVRVFLGYVDPASSFVSSQSRGCGSTPVYDDYFAPVATGESPNAVVVTAAADVRFVLHPDSGAACRSALGLTESTACFALGSYAAAVRTGDSTLLAPLNDLLGANLSLASYQNIAATSVTLASLAANPRFGTATQLLAGSIRISDLVLAMVDVLNLQNATANAAAVTALNKFVTTVGTLPEVTLGDLLHVSPTDSAALATNFNTLDVLAGAILLADGNHAVAIPNVWANVAGTGHTADADLFIQQGASLACGAPNSSQAAADNSQLHGYVNFDQMNTPSFNIGYGNLKTAAAVGRLSIDLAPAHAQLTSPPAVVCGQGTAASPTTFAVEVASGLARAALTISLPITGQVSVLGLGLVTLNLTINIEVATTESGRTTVANLSIPPNDMTPISTGSTVRLNSAAATIAIDPNSTATLLGLPLTLTNTLLIPVLNAVLGSVQSIFVAKTVTPLVSNLNDLLMGPLASLLGLDVGGADVFAIRSACGRPVLGG